MVSRSELRERALALPEVAEGSHFGMPAFAVQGTGFVSISKDDRLQLRLGAAEVAEAVAELPNAEPVLRKDTPIGVAVPLAVLNPAQLDRWLTASWADRAPAALVRDLRPASTAVDLPEELPAPARRALTSAGISTLTDVASSTRSQLLALHGFGPKALRILEEAVTGAGLRWPEG